MMKLCLVIVLVLCGSYADDELPEDFASLLSQLSDDLDHQLQKRLTDLDPDLNLLDKDEKVDQSKLVNDKGSSCFYKVSEQKIIKTRDSINNGATYIDSPTDSDILNQTACRAECCSLSECDLAVFKAKGDEHACYLFVCGGACLFTNHTGFTTMEKHRMAQQHEADLANLATDTPSTKALETTTTTTQRTTTTTTASAADKVPLFGTCVEDSNCAESRAECLAGYCVCKQGSHAQEGVCREECSRFQFECANEGKPLSYPQCIAIYDTCDGIPHCADGSDELKCEPRGSSSSSSDAKTVDAHDLDELASLVEEFLESETKGSGQKTPGLGSQNTGRYRGRQSGSAGNNVMTPPRSQVPDQRPNHVRGQAPEGSNGQRKIPYPGNTDNSRGRDGVGRSDRPPAGSAKKDAPAPPQSPEISHSEKPVVPHQEVQNKVPQPPEDAPKKQAPAQKVPEKKNIPSPTPTPPPETTPQADTSTQAKEGISKKPSHSGGGSGVVAKHVAPKEELVNDAENEPTAKASNKTAVVVLAMGLAVTALLLIFVGCRLRMVKRRLRRGRPLNSNEADYLINGMYL